MAFGQPLAPLNIAVAAALFVLVLRSMLHHRWAVPEPGAVVAWSLGALVALVILVSPTPEIVQRGVSIYLLASAAAILGVVRFLPDMIARIPSMWSGEGRGAADAMGLVAMSLALRAIGAWLLALSGEEALWVLFVSVGGLAVDFLTNWVVLLYLFLNRLNERRQ